MNQGGPKDEGELRVGQTEGADVLEGEVLSRLTTIKESDASAEKEGDYDSFDAESSYYQTPLTFLPDSSAGEGEELAQAQQQIAALVQKMDLHKNGLLYLKELVWRCENVRTWCFCSCLHR